MAKRYDPILCMLVDEPTKAQDAMPSDLKKAGYEVGTVEKYGSTYYTLVYNGKVISTSPTEANIVEKAKKHYANRHGKAQDAGFVLRHKNGQYMSSAGRTNEKAKAKVFSSKREAEAYKGDYVVSSTDPDYHNWSVVAVDSASTLDKAIKTCDAVDVDRISNYLWLWVEGREVAGVLFNEGLDKYSGPHDKEHKDEAYDFAKKYAQKELDALYSKLKSSVEKKLKEGYTNVKNTINSAK